MLLEQPMQNTAEAFHPEVRLRRVEAEVVQQRVHQLLERALLSRLASRLRTPVVKTHQFWSGEAGSCSPGEGIWARDLVCPAW